MNNGHSLSTKTDRRSITLGAMHGSEWI